MQMLAFPLLALACLQTALCLEQDVIATTAVAMTEAAPSPATTLFTMVLTARQIADQSDGNFGTTTYNSDYPQGTQATNAGASGQDNGSFKISQGAIIAIVVVCVVVVLLGVASTVLFIVAKRRQWNVRASIARASRRLSRRITGRAPERSQSEAAKRRGGTIIGPAPKSTQKTTAGDKRGPLVVEVQPMKELNKNGSSK